MAGSSRQERFVSGGRANDSRLRVPQVDSGIYKVLFRVIIRHGYNDASRGLCKAFKIAPSPSSADLMRSHGMVFQDTGTGFAVYIRDTQIESFVSYLRRQGWANPAGVQYWSWLSFVLVPQDPFFVGITSLPIDTNPLYENLYGTNQDAHRADAVTLITSGPAMSAGDVVPVTAAQFTVAAPGPFDQVVVRDISGRVVLVVPSDADIAEKKRELGEITEDDLHYPLGPTYVQVDLSTLPLGLYTYNIWSVRDVESEPVTLLYTAANPGPPLTFLDVLFSRPDASQGGIYPVPPLYTDEPIYPDDVGNVTYELRFETRQTWWQYYVVSQTPGSVLTHLEIAGDGVTFTRAPQPVLLPNGEIATLFQSDETLAMRQIPPQRFALNGTRRDARGKVTRIHVDPLPAAPIAPVWPPPLDTNPPGPANVTGTSEMFVYV